MQTQHEAEHTANKDCATLKQKQQHETKHRIAKLITQNETQVCKTQQNKRTQNKANAKQCKHNTRQNTQRIKTVQH